MVPLPIRTPPAPGPPPDEPLVLIIEDDDDTRFLYAEALVHLGYRAAGEGDALSGIDAALRLRPAAILMDLSMPGMGGIEAIRKLKADPRTSDCAIVVVTGSGLKWFAAARDAGCDAFFGKPFDPAMLDHVLRAPAEPPTTSLAPDVVKRCSCGREFTRLQWFALPRCGRMHLGQRQAVVEVRNCACGSSLTLQIEALDDGGQAIAALPNEPTKPSEVLETIVVVDRDVHVRRLILHFVGSAYLVEFLDDGYAALDRVRRAPPAALVSEIMTARLDGLALCKLLKGDARTCAVPILLFSVLAASARAEQAGADAFVSKPLEKQLFVSSLLGLMEKHA